MRRLIIPLAFLIASSGSAQTFHGDNARTGVYATTGPTSSPSVKWRFKTEGPIMGSPAVSQGVVFIGSDDGDFYAIDQKSGQLKWKFQTKGRIASSAAVSNGVVFFSSFDGGFYALDAATGKQKWRFAMKYERRFEARGLNGFEPHEQTIADPWDFYASSPVVAGGLVYFGSGDGTVYAVDAEIGALRWSFATGGVVHSSPAIDGDTLYIGSFDTFLYALHADTGLEKWRFKTGEDHERFNQTGITSSPVVANGTVYFGCRDAHLYAVDAVTGKQQWAMYTDHGWVSSTPSVRNGEVYIGTGSNAQFLALDGKSGKPRFSVPIKSAFFSSTAVAGDFAYVGSTNGTLYAYELRDGKVAWEFQTDSARADVRKLFNPDGTWNPETLGKSVYTDFQNMYITMEKRFSVGAIFSSPVVDAGELYFASADGYVYALK